MDVRRRELDFDLSGPQKPRPCWKEPGVQVIISTVGTCACLGHAAAVYG